MFTPNIINTILIDLFTDFIDHLQWCLLFVMYEIVF